MFKYSIYTSIYTAIVPSSSGITFAISYLHHIRSCPNKVVTPAPHVPHAAPCPSSLTPAASPQGQCRDCTQNSCFLRRCWLQQHTHFLTADQDTPANNGASPHPPSPLLLILPHFAPPLPPPPLHPIPLLLIHSPILPSPPFPLPLLVMVLLVDVRLASVLRSHKKMLFSRPPLTATSLSGE